MSKLDDFEERLKYLQKNFAKFANAALSKQVELMKQLNIKQLNQGVKADESLLPPYKRSTVRIKFRKGQQTDPMNLRNTGRFHNRIRFKVRSNKIYVEDTDPKTSALETNFGEVLGLTGPSRDIVADVAKEDLKNDIRDFLHGSKL